jgi:hypothetical protein
MHNKISQSYTTALLCFSLKPYAQDGFEPGSSFPEVDARSTPTGLFGKVVAAKKKGKKCAIL